jgi:hypothetical protein
MVKKESSIYAKSEKKLSGLQKNLNNKKFVYQFLPHFFNDVINQRKIRYKEKNLKVDYLVDIINNLILKYYINKTNGFPLNSSVLKERYGMNYNYYIDYLVDIKVINLDKDYLKSVSSRIYSLKPIVFSKKMTRYENKDSFVLKKYTKRVLEDYEICKKDGNLIEFFVREKLIEDLFSVEIDEQRSMSFLNTIKGDGTESYNKNSYAVGCVRNNHIFYHFDKYGRMHTNFTILKSFIRKNCLKIGGSDVREIDISNSQPLFLTKLIEESGTKWVNKEEFDIFKALTKNGNFYKYLMTKLDIRDRKKAKTMTYSVLFGNHVYKSKSDKMFQKLFPTIFNFINLYKRECGNYKKLSCDLQRMESNVIFNRIVKTVMERNPSIRMITVHDSIIVPIEHYDYVNDIFQKILLSEFSF